MRAICISLRIASVAIITAMLAFSMASAQGQVSPEEHALHHPPDSSGGGSAPDSQPVNPTGGMGDMMGGMMESMHGGSPEKEFYPSLMGLPDLPLERRSELLERSSRGILEGITGLQNAVLALQVAQERNDSAAIQDALLQMREATARLDSAFATQRALEEGQAPRRVAMEWFKTNLDLLPVRSGGSVESPFGISWTHSIVMAGLVVFAACMIGLYFLRMRRAALLLEALAGSDIAGGVKLDSPSVQAPSIAASLPSKWKGNLNVGRIIPEAKDVKTFRLVSADGKRRPFDFLPGQFLTFSVSHEGKPVKRSYTIASSPTQTHYLDVTVKRESNGIVSRLLHDTITEGSELSVSGPSGRFVFTGEQASSIVLIGGGVGITPLMSVVRYLTDRVWNGNITLVYACRTPEHYIFREELEQLERLHPNFNLHVTMSQSTASEWKGRLGRIDLEWLSKIVTNASKALFHLCGPLPMIEATKLLLYELGVSETQIRTETFGGKPIRKLAASPESAPSHDAPRVTFEKSAKEGILLQDETILELAERIGVEIDYSCRVGTCGSCVVKLIAGNITMECDDGLEDADRASGMILACQAKSHGDVTIEA